MNKTVRDEIANLLIPYMRDSERFAIADQILQIFKGVVDEGEIVNLLATTKLGTGHNFADSTDFDLHLKDWRIGKREIMILAHAIRQSLIDKIAKLQGASANT